MRGVIKEPKITHSMLSKGHSIAVLGRGGTYVLPTSSSPAQDWQLGWLHSSQKIMSFDSSPRVWHEAHEDSSKFFGSFTLVWHANIRFISCHIVSILYRDLDRKSRTNFERDFLVRFLPEGSLEGSKTSRGFAARRGFEHVASILRFLRSATTW